MASIKTVLEIDNSKYIAGLKQAADATKSFGRDLGTQSTNIIGAFGAMGLSAGALGAVLTGLSVSTAHFADQITDLATAHQTTIGEVLALSKALAQNGGSADQTGRMMQTLANNMDAVNNGNLKLYNTFANLGVSMNDLGSLSESQIRNKLIAGIAAIQDPATRAAKAVEIFGKAAVGVDFTNLAASIAANNVKYAEHDAAVRSAAQAYDSIQSALTDIKIAFAEAFKPFFDVIGRLKIDIDGAAAGFKVLAIGIAAVTSAAAIAGAYKLVTAFQALKLAVVTNPIGAVATVLLTAGAAFGILSTKTDEATAATENNTDAAQKNIEIKRDQAELGIALQKEVEGLQKITSAYVKQNETIQKKLNLELASLGQTEEQKRISQQVADIETSREKSLLDLKNQYNTLDADGRARTSSEYQKQQEIIKQNADIEINAATQQIRLIEQRRRAYEDIVGGLKIFSEAEVKLFKSLQDRVPVGARQQIAQEELVNAAIEKRRILIDEINKQKLSPQLGSMADSVLEPSIEAARKSFQDTVNQLRQMNRGELQPQIVALISATQKQLEATDTAAQALIRIRQQVLDTQRTFSYGWEKAYTDYLDQTRNFASTASTLFNKFTTGLEDAFVKFAKTGKLTFKDLVNTMVEELLRAQIRQLIANMFPTGGGGGGGLAGILGGLIGGGSRSQPQQNSGGGILDSLFNGVKSIFGFANGGYPPMGQPYIVGENGPELRVDSTAGQIIPLNGLGTNVTYNINAVDAASFQALVARDPGFIYAVSEQGRRSLPGTRR